MKPHDASFIQRDRLWQPKALTPDYRSSRLRAPEKPLVLMPNTLSEAAGPVFGHDILGELDHDLVHNYGSPDQVANGPRILVHGRVMDEHGRGVPNALVEVWQANAGGRYRHKNDDYLAPLDPGFGGCGRVITAEDGSYRFLTIRPGPYPWPNHENAWRPQHIHFSIFGSGFAQRLITQMYFEGDPLIPLCPIVSAISDKKAVEQLIAVQDMEAATSMDHLAYRFDIVLRGRNSTFFENRLEGN